MSMRVELKKEQEYQGLRFGWMYLGALLGACVAASSNDQILWMGPRLETRQSASCAGQTH
jgi:hypothetical protein